MFYRVVLSCFPIHHFDASIVAPMLGCHFVDTNMVRFDAFIVQLMTSLLHWHKYFQFWCENFHSLCKNNNDNIHYLMRTLKENIKFTLCNIVVTADIYNFWCSCWSTMQRSTWTSINKALVSLFASYHWWQPTSLIHCDTMFCRHCEWCQT